MGVVGGLFCQRKDEDFFADAKTMRPSGAQGAAVASCWLALGRVPAVTLLVGRSGCAVEVIGVSLISMLPVLRHAGLLLFRKCELLLTVHTAASASVILLFILKSPH